MKHILRVRRTCFVGILIVMSATAVLADGARPLKLAPPQGAETAARATNPASFLDRNSLRSVGSALAIVLGLFTLWTALQRSQQHRASAESCLQALGAIQVTPKVKLHVVRLGQRLLVLHLAGGRVERIAEIQDPGEVEQIVNSRHAVRGTGAKPRVDELLQAVDRANCSAPEWRGSP